MAGSTPDLRKDEAPTAAGGVPPSTPTVSGGRAKPLPSLPADARPENQVTNPFEGTLPTAPVPANSSFGRYELRGEAKAGGMGLVFKARDTALDRVVALKMLKAGAVAGSDEIARFQREARAVARMKHPHIVPIHDVSQERGLHYLTMEYVEGGSLSQHLARFADNPCAAAALVEKVARAVHYAHQRNILHRDLKPANILLDEAGEPRVSDFGLAKFLDAPSRPPDATVPAPAAEGATDMTPTCDGGQPPAEMDLRTFGPVGTPAYMSPEQVSGGQVTRGTDVWALGVILYQLLTGKLPFAGLDRAELAEQILRGQPRSLRQCRPGLDRALESICLKCLRKDPAGRYLSAEALANDLARWLRGGPLLARPWRFARRRPFRAAALVLLLGVVTAAVAAALWPENPDRPLKTIQKELRQGKSVTLIGPAGPPAWFRWRGGEIAARIVPRGDQAFTIETLSGALLELLPDPEIDSYRFSTEVRQGDAKGGCAGLYFGRSTIDTGKTNLHFFGEWTFKEPAADPARARLGLRCREFKPLFGGGETGIKVSYACAEYWDNDLTRGFGSWRRLSLEVGPWGIRAYCEGRKVAEKSREQIGEGYRRWMNVPFVNQSLANVDFTSNSHVPSFAARAGLGFYIEGCSASFRNVTIEPLVDGD